MTGAIPGSTHEGLSWVDLLSRVDLPGDLVESIALANQGPWQSDFVFGLVLAPPMRLQRLFKLVLDHVTAGKGSGAAVPYMVLHHPNATETVRRDAQAALPFPDWQPEPVDGHLYLERLERSTAGGVHHVLGAICGGPQNGTSALERRRMGRQSGGRADIR